MKWLDLLHRWTGGVIGLVLGLLGLTGCLLVWKTALIMVPGKAMPLIRDPASVAAAVQRLLPQPKGGESVVFADNDFALHQLRLVHGAGAYADQGGRIVDRWSSQWERPELWLFDFHHHLFASDIGETVIGIAGLCGLFFVVSGAILWWRTRRTFKWRLLPKRMSRPAILMHHRDLGIIVAPLLLLSSITGAAMVFRPVAMIVVAPFGSPAKALAALRPGKVHGGPLAASPPWRAMLTTASQRFPDAVPRILAMPRKPGDPITLRMRRADEWLPNGRTTLVFDAATGRLLSSNDAMAMPRAARVYNMLYPLHAGRVGGLAWKLLMTVSGLALTLLGSLAVWTFWFRRPRRPVRTSRP
ncbi:PepSY-associated TM helix domain-containing protein [Sphingomonas sp. gentR]|uniref:PepSY-associated TM helix domain-containing protein n=1 Tax=unclassified Sphingomonas TaxID=196159 RepID=UPI0009728F67|nr:PepSY-associated TM helix domain-containing protein [Sphingomonas sp. LK11]APX66163.1 peptidase [Sphingomonas sp. LK11]